MPDEPVHAALLVASGEIQGTRFELKAEETLLGRDPECDLTLPDGGVSRQHAVVLFDREAGRFSVEDLQSTNGTKVNGKMGRSAVLEDGDTIQLGRTLLRFEAPAR